jgi:hypothetical protein
MAGNEWRSLRVYVSSVFDDAFGERAHLDSVVCAVLPTLRQICDSNHFWLPCVHVLLQVFPALEEYCACRRVELIPVDLRHRTSDDKSTLEVCLDEINRADVFVGLLGSKYGDCLPGAPGRPYFSPPDHEYTWLSSYPEGRSLIELEAARVATNRKSADRSATVQRVLFYERDNSFLVSVPNALKSKFLDGDAVWDMGNAVDFTPDPVKAGLLADLKAAVRAAAQASGEAAISAVSSYPPKVNTADDDAVSSEAFHAAVAAAKASAMHPLTCGSIRYHRSPYFCDYRKVVEGGDVPQVTKLEVWGQTVLKDLKDAVEAIYPLLDTRHTDSLSADRSHHISYAVSLCDMTYGRDGVLPPLLSEIRCDALSALPRSMFTPATDSAPVHKAIVIVGDPGVGKTATVASIVKALESSIFAHKQAVRGRSIFVQPSFVSCAWHARFWMELIACVGVVSQADMSRARSRLASRGREAGRRGSITAVSGQFETVSPGVAMFAHFAKSCPGANDSRALQQRLCSELHRIILLEHRAAKVSCCFRDVTCAASLESSDCCLLLQLTSREIAAALLGGLPGHLSSSAVVQRAVEWLTGTGSDGSKIVMEGGCCNGASRRVGVSGVGF